MPESPELESSAEESPLSPETLALAEKLDLKAQYGSQVEMLREAKIFEFLPGERAMGILGIDGKEYPIPEYKEILASIDQDLVKRELLERKYEQGFEKLLLVPLGMPLDSLINKYKQALLKHHQEKKLFDTEGNIVDLNPDNPIYIDSAYQGADDKKELIYYPQRYTKDNHQGKTKQELIDEGRAWEVILIEDLPDLPAEGEGKTINGRKQLEANRSADDYLQALQTDPQYQGERGLIMEANLIYALTYLREKNQVIDNYQYQQAKGRICRLLGAMFLSGAGVLHSYFYRDDRRAGLHWNYPDLRYPSVAARAGVQIF